MAKKYIYSEAKVLNEFVGALLKNLIVNRKSKVSWINKQQLDILKAIKNVNNKCNWNFNVSICEPLQYTVYEEKDHYDWHIDSHSKPYDNGFIRKLSFTICLNDFMF